MKTQKVSGFGNVRIVKSPSIIATVGSIKFRKEKDPGQYKNSDQTTKQSTQTLETKCLASFANKPLEFRDLTYDLNIMKF